MTEEGCSREGVSIDSAAGDVGFASTIFPPLIVFIPASGVLWGAGGVSDEAEVRGPVSTGPTGTGRVLAESGSGVKGPAIAGGVDLFAVVDSWEEDGAADGAGVQPNPAWAAEGRKRTNPRKTALRVRYFFMLIVEADMTAPDPKIYLSSSIAK